MSTPDDRTYSSSHEWHQLDGDTLTIGITQYAVDQLTDVTFAEMKPAGTEVAAGDAIGEVESVKTTSDVYAAAGGEIIEVNPELDGNPGVLNEDPYGAGWLIKLRVTDRGTLDELVDAATYDKEHAV